MIERYTRPELGAIWTDEARMEAWRRVEVAACEEMDGPTEADLEAIRGATFTVEAVEERERTTGHDYYAAVCFHIYIKDNMGVERALADGGFTSWTQQLLNNQKERLLISGIGTELVCSLFGKEPVS